MEGQDTEVLAQGQEQVNTDKATEQNVGNTEKMLTQSEHEAQMAKVQSTYEKKAFQAEREAKQAREQLTQQETDFAALQEQVSKLTDEIERRELAGLENLPEGQKLVQMHSELRKERQSIDKQRREVAKREADAKEGLKFRDALNLSKEYGIDVDELMECDTMKGMYEKIAKNLKEKSTVVEKPPPAKVPEHVDSGISVGDSKGKIWKASEIAAMSSDERFSRREEIVKAGKEGRIDNTK